MVFANNSNILKDPIVFIGDTGATCDSTFSKIGLTNKQQAGKLDNIVDLSGNGIKGNVVGDMPSIVCNKNGQEKLDVIIKGIMHLPQAGYILFSITNRLEEGWTLGDGTEAIWFTKGKKKSCLASRSRHLKVLSLQYI
eukprot:15332909-Ditylum_brightwellii.AAC.1